MSATTIEHDERIRSTIWRGWRHLGSGVLAGAACGLVIGGIGGRLAMFVLRLTSRDGLRGIDTDDGFTIGQISFETIFLLLICTIGGVLGGVVYLAARGWIPRRLRGPVAAVTSGTLLGSAIIKPEGVDFRLVGPRWLAVTLFLTISAGFGLGLVWTCERLLGSRRWQGGFVPAASAVAVVPTLFLGGIGLLLLPLAWIIGMAGNRMPMHWRRGAIPLVGRGLIAATVIAGSIALVRDLGAVL